MKLKINYYFKQYFNFSRKDRNGIVILSSIIFVVMLVNFFLGKLNFSKESDFSELKQYLAGSENKDNNLKEKNLSLFPFNPNTITSLELDSLLLPKSIKNNLLKYRNSGGKFYSATDFRKLYGMNDSIFSEIKDFILTDPKENTRFEKKLEFEKKEQISEKSFKEFNPNQVDYDELVLMGFSKFQAKNLVEFRKKRGNFKKKEDLLKIYGIDSGFYSTVKDYIKIDVPNVENRVEAKKELKRIELNSCSIEDLQELRGIGEILAERIVKYRDLLGGYYSQNQLLEVYGFSNDAFNAIKNTVYADTLAIKKIRINFYGMSDLPRHPYLKYNHFKSILNYRGKKGAFISAKQLLEAQLIDSVSFKRIEPYINCR